MIPLKVGDIIINKVRTDDKLPNGMGQGTILRIDDSLYLIRWHCPSGIYIGHMRSNNKTLYESCAHKGVIELDISEIRNDKLFELGI